MGFPGGSVVKNPPASGGDTGSIPWSGDLSRRRKWQTTPLFLPGKSHEHKNLVGYSFVGLQRVKYDLETK